MLVKIGVEKLGRMNDVSVKYLKKGREGERGIFFSQCGEPECS